jgi:hypothetical protein
MEQENLLSRYEWPVEMGAIGSLVVKRENPGWPRPAGGEYRSEAQRRTSS